MTEQNFDDLDPELEAQIAAGEELAAEEEELARYVRYALGCEEKIAALEAWAKRECDRIRNDWLPAVLKEPTQGREYLRRVIAAIIAKIEERQGKPIKHYDVPTGRVCFRVPPPRLEVTDEDALLLAAGTDDRFSEALCSVPATVTVDKGVLKGLLKKYDANLPGIAWTRGETKMVIEPPKRSPADPETYGREPDVAIQE